jgi:predicted Zn-dependent protease with MMP-like domain
MDAQDFENVVRQTLDTLPEQFRKQLDNVQVVIEDRPQDKSILQKLRQSHQLLLGLYHGVPKTRRFGYGNLPDKISIYREPILQIALDEEDAKRIIKDTVLHELGHHFGLSDEDLERIRKHH